MALSAKVRRKIESLTNKHWKGHVRDTSFREMTSGKEAGHRIADYVDDRTCALLKVNLDTRYEGDGKGNIRKRSMGDIWIHSQEMYNPINVKSGLQNMNGQPNVVSMQKLLDYLLKRWIDSYYLLIIKFDLSTNITHKFYFIDLLDWLDYITYDAGPGQIMLREQNLYEAIDSGAAPERRTVFEKVEMLFDLFERQLENLYRNRRDRLERQRNLSLTFQESPFIVDQSQMRFVVL